jgi:hypothetical protein
VRREWIIAAVISAACSAGDSSEQQAASDVAAELVHDSVQPAAVQQDTAVVAARPVGEDDDVGPRSDLPPNELGRIPVLEYHLIGGQEGRWTRTPENLRADLELLYSRGYRPVTLVDGAGRNINLPRGTSVNDK